MAMIGPIMWTYQLLKVLVYINLYILCEVKLIYFLSSMIYAQSIGTERGMSQGTMTSAGAYY